VSVAVKKWVRRHPARTGPQQQVLEALAWAADDDGRGARLSYRQLAAESSLHRNTVLRALRVLREDDRIRRHVGGREHCEQCRRAGRGVAVYDVVIPAEQLVADGQMNLLTGTSTGTSDWHTEVPAAEGLQHLSGASSGTSLVPLEEKRTVNHHHLEGAREQSEDGLRALVAEVISILERVEKPGWSVDPIAVEAIVLTWAPHRDPLRAAAQVVATAMNHHRVNAAQLLGNTLSWQRLDLPAGGQRPRAGAAPVEPEQLPERFAKYDRAMGLA
jgi:hypothetical protein